MSEGTYLVIALLLLVGLLCPATERFVAIFLQVLIASHLLDFAWRKMKRGFDVFAKRWRVGDRVPQGEAFTVLVTGGALGLGREIAREYAQLGYSLVLWDINRAALQEAKAQLQAMGCDVGISNVDVSDDLAVGRATKSLPPIHILVLNAGIVSGKPVEHSSSREVTRVFGVNVFHLFHVSRHVIPTMRCADKRRVVVIGSVAGWSGVSRLADYNGSKAAANIFAESLRFELIDSNVGVTLVCPYVINTGMFRGMRDLRFFPTLTASRVARAVVAGVRDEKWFVVVPWVFYWLNVGRQLLPSTAVLLLDKIFLASTAMNSFEGSTSRFDC